MLDGAHERADRLRPCAARPGRACRPGDRRRLPRVQPARRRPVAPLVVAVPAVRRLPAGAVGRRHHEVLGEANTIPCRYDGTIEGLPRGIDEVVAAGLPDIGVPAAPTALCALAIAIPPGQQNRGQSRLLLGGMRALAAEHGWAQLIAPVRPNWKARYPLVPIHRYAAWTRPDGLPFDPWLRVHARLGGRILGAEPESLRISGPVAQWEGWVQMALPESGRYVFPGGLALLHVDRAGDVGLYYEPNVWVGHVPPL